MFSLLFAGVAASTAPAIEAQAIEQQLLRPGPMAAENTYLRPGRAGDNDAFSVDLAVKDMRVDGDTLYVLVKNEGGLRAEGPLKVTAHARIGAITTDAASATTVALGHGQSRWVPVRGFSVKTASMSGPAFTLDNATVVAATISTPVAIPAALNRSGLDCDRCISDSNRANDSLQLVGAAITHGRPQ